MRLRRLAGLTPVLLGALAAVAWLPHSPSDLRDLVLAAGVAAPLIALAAWVLLTPALFPGTVLAAATGLAFGAVGGAVLAWSGAVLGGLAAFTLARTVARGPAVRLVRRTTTLARVHALLERRGFASILAARLMPGVPASGLYLAAGASPVRAAPFAAAIAVGALLRTTPYALLGHGLGSGSASGVVIAAASAVIGGGAAMLLIRRLRAPVPAT